MQFKDYYQQLGVERDATADVIKKAFRKLARKYHPDVSKEPDADQRMKEVNEAYTVLSDPEKRAAYDQLGRNPQAGQDFQPPPGWDAGFEFSGHESPGGQSNGANAAEFSDFFSQLFGRGGAQRGFGGHGQFRMQGEDHHAKVMLDIEDSFTGATRQITLNAAGIDDSGHLSVKPRTLNVKIPRGVTEGQTIRLAGQGAPGHGGAPAGDLLLEVHFRPHQQLRVSGHDLSMTLKVTPWEAALGATVEVPLPDSTIKLRIPAGAQSGQPLRVRGKGLPSQPPGDLLVEIQVVLPAATTPRARELYETMAQELAFDPRQDQAGSSTGSGTGSGK
jgi:curved DNA-binding protein